MSSPSDDRRPVCRVDILWSPKFSPGTWYAICRDDQNRPCGEGRGTTPKDALDAAWAMWSEDGTYV